MIYVMEHAARQITALGAEIHYLRDVTTVAQPAGPGSRWDVTSTTLPPPSTPNFTSEASIEHYDKLIIATGCFSDPVVPSFAIPFVLPPRATIAQETFKLDEDAPFAIHTSHLSEPGIQRAVMGKKRTIVVVGGSKSALDTSERLALVSVPLRSCIWRGEDPRVDERVLFLFV